MTLRLRAILSAIHLPVLLTVLLAAGGLLPLTFFAAQAQAAWVPDGTPLCALPNGQSIGQAASDGGSGAIVVWSDNRSGGTDIYAQRVDMNGNILWAAGGVAVCTASGSQYNPKLTTDGSGGAVIVWLDMRSGNNDLYAQRIDSNGNTLWTANGVSVCTEADNQTSPTIISGGSGSVVIAWEDYRSGTNWDIYAQRLNGADGAQLWAAGGRAICTATGNQYYPQTATDGAAGAIITWQDYRGANYDLYAQRVNLAGTPQWTNNGVVVCNAANNQVNPVIVSDGVGGAIIAWQDYRSGTNYDIYAQRLTGTGTVSWAANGVSLCAAANDQTSLALISDAASGSIITWQDSRGGGADIYAQRVSSAGAGQWTADGVMVCGASGGQNRPAIATDGSGGAIIAWEDIRSGSSYDVYTQKVNSAGTVIWAAPGIAISTASGDQMIAQIVSDSYGGAIVAWQDSRSVTDTDIYAGHVDGDGNAGWTHCGVPISVAQRSQSSVKVVSDGGGGAIMAWEDFRNSPTESDIYAQRVFSDGYRLWSKNGLGVSTASGNQMNHAVAPDASNGLLVAWEDTRNGSYDIYGQRVGPIQNILWRQNGAVVCSTTATTYCPQLTSDGTGGAIVVWENIVGAGTRDIYAQRINASGSQMWASAGVAVCSAANHQYGPQIVSDAAGGAIIAWYDMRGASADVYAQRVDANGNALWTVNGVVVCGASGSQNGVRMIPDGSGGAIICWTDTRGGTYDVYAQKINSSGVAQWTSNGVGVCTASGSQYSAVLTTDGAGGAIITWQDYRGANSDVYAQRVNSTGTPVWIADGVVVNASADAQTSIDITTDGSNGAIVTWQDYRSSVSNDVYAQKINSSGNIVWETGGNVVCTSGDDETRPVIIYSTSGQAIIAWNSFNINTSDDVYALSTSYSVSVPDERPRVTPRPEISLDQNFPNPFNPVTKIVFTMSEPGQMRLCVYDIAGRVVRVLKEGSVDAGGHEVTWDGKDDAGERVASGVYFYSLETEKASRARKMVIIR